MHHSRVTIDPGWEKDRIEYVKRLALDTLVRRIAPFLLDRTYTVSITSELTDSRIYSNCQEYTLTADITEVL